MTAITVQSSLSLTSQPVGDSLPSGTSISKSPFDEIRGHRADGSEYWTARELMRWLGFSNWQKFEAIVMDALEDIELISPDTGIENIIQTDKLVSRPSRGNTSIRDYEMSRLGCYHVTLACKKRTPEVATARRYFAVQTRKAEVTQTATTELSRLEILQMALASEESRIFAEQAKSILEAQIEADLPATELGKAICKSVSNIRVGDFAKSIGMGQNRYFQELRECGIMMATSTLPYQRFLTAGYFVVTQVIQGNKTFPVSLITPKGQAYLVKRHRQYQQGIEIECQAEALVSALV